MGNHFIPQYYLNGFVDNSTSGSVWTYEKGTGRYFPARKRRIANENKFYTDEIEKYLTQSIENPANTVIDKIINHQLINLDEKKILARYIIAIYKRVPEGKSRILKKAPDHLDNSLNKIEEILQNLKINNPNSIVIQDRLNELKTVRNQLQSDPIFRDQLFNGVWQEVIKPDRTPKSFTTIFLMNWQFVISDIPVFLTCDNPFFFFKEIGLGNPKSEFSFPISDKICLVASWSNLVKDVFLNVTTLQTEILNDRIVYNAGKFIFSSTKSERIVNLVKQGNFNLVSLFHDKPI